MDVNDIRVDLVLKGHVWVYLFENLVDIYFDTYYQVFELCASIGIMKDCRKKIELTKDENENSIRTIPRSVLYKKTNELGLLFYTAIIATETEKFDIDQRLEFAFSENAPHFNKMKFLEEFANYGAELLYNELQDNMVTEIATMDTIINMFNNYLHEDYLDDIEIDTSYL